MMGVGIDRDEDAGLHGQTYVAVPQIQAGRIGVEFQTGPVFTGGGTQFRRRIDISMYPCQQCDGLTDD